MSETGVVLGGGRRCCWAPCLPRLVEFRKNEGTLFKSSKMVQKDDVYFSAWAKRLVVRTSELEGLCVNHLSPSVPNMDAIGPNSGWIKAGSNCLVHFSAPIDGCHCRAVSPIYKPFTALCSGGEAGAFGHFDESDPLSLRLIVKN